MLTKKQAELLWFLSDKRAMWVTYTAVEDEYGSRAGSDLAVVGEKDFAEAISLALDALTEDGEML